VIFNEEMVRSTKTWKEADDNELDNVAGVGYVLSLLTRIHRLSPPPQSAVCCGLRLFSAVTPADVVASVKVLPDKQCASDRLPTWLLKKCVGVISPFLCQLFNWSLEHSSVPSSFKCAYITPLLKKADLEPADVKSYRPISNLSVVSKLLECTRP